MTQAQSSFTPTCLPPGSLPQRLHWLEGSDLSWPLSTSSDFGHTVLVYNCNMSLITEYNVPHIGFIGLLRVRPVPDPAEKPQPFSAVGLLLTRTSQSLADMQTES